METEVRRFGDVKGVKTPTRSQFVRVVEQFQREFNDALRWHGSGELMQTAIVKNMAERLKNYLDGLSKCPKCGSGNAIRTHEWTSDVSGTVYCIDYKCLECGNDWSW